MMQKVSSPFRALALALVAGAAAIPVDAIAQDGPFPFLNQQPTAPPLDSDPAEALARYLRVLGDRPNDMAALTGAARAALACGDPTSSIGFWARADKLQPNNAATKAGLAAALVQAEQPKLALKLFDQATALGEPEAAIAADRGLARDLRGDNRAAQKDYQLALKDRNDPETVRRYALSLAMSGDRAGALAALDPLLRKQDMGAWRARAFVLALTGDTAGAVADAHQVLAKPQADQISPFLVRLASLTPAQQAAAVHFGDMPSGGSRPPVTTVDLARAAETVPVGQTAQVALAQRATIPSQPISRPTLPAQRPTGVVDFAGRPLTRSSGSAPPVVSSPAYASVQTTSALNSAALLASRNQGAPARSVPGPQPAPAGATQPAATQVARIEPAPTLARAQPEPSRSLPDGARPVAAALEDQPTARSPAAPEATPPRLALAPVADAPITAPATLAPASETKPAQLAANTLGAEAAADGARLPPTPTPAPAATATRGPIVEHVEPAPRAAPRAAAIETAEATVPTPAKAASKPVQIASAGSARKSKVAPEPESGVDDTAVARGKARKGSASSNDDDAVPPRKTRAQALADAKAAAARVAADKQAAADKLAAAKQAKADKLAKAQEKAAPSRIWVQVAGGANRNDLGKAWDKLKKAAPDLYAGQKPSTTPLRFTNRLLVGPFKSEDDAQAYVNRLTKSGQSGFMFKSSGGQKVEAVASK